MQSGKTKADELIQFLSVADETERDAFIKHIFNRRKELNIEAKIAFYDFLKAASKDGNQKALALFAKIKQKKELEPPQKWVIPC